MGWEPHRRKAVYKAGERGAAARCACSAWRWQPCTAGAGRRGWVDGCLRARLLRQAAPCALQSLQNPTDSTMQRCKALGDSRLQAKLLFWRREGEFGGRPRASCPGQPCLLAGRKQEYCPRLPRRSRPLHRGGGSTSGTAGQQKSPTPFPLGKAARFQPGSHLSAALSKGPGTQDVFQGSSSAGQRGGIIHFKD